MESLLDLNAISSAPGAGQRLALDVILRATLALAAGALFCAASRRASASVRHLVWTSALAGVLVLPVLMLNLPSWRVPILPQAKPALGPSLHDALPEGLPPSIARESLSRLAAAERVDPRRNLQPLTGPHGSPRPGSSGRSSCCRRCWPASRG